ncbi:MAG: molybdate ABC transporter substrate-binding protein [Anaerolinea sp.]|nr:molybdate ABC transporter substrate-binding protein [Anaerolinea sp.]
MKKSFVWIVALLLVLTSAAVHAQEQRTLIVFAAASLTDAFEQIGADFEAKNPGVEVLFNFGGSSDLAAQLAEGAPADVFASANQRQMTVAEDEGRLGSNRRVFVRNRLVVITPFDNPGGMITLGDLATPGLRLVIAAPDVPVRDYTDAMLETMAADPAYGEAYRAAFMANVVSEEPNVRQVTAKVALGEADAGIVYASDVTPEISDSVVLIAIPDEFNTLATYPIAVTNDSANPELARAFVGFVLSTCGQTTLAYWGFIPARAIEPLCQPRQS